MLIQHAWTICDADRLDAEIEYLKKIFRQNGYNDYDIKQALCHKKKKPTGVAVLLPASHLTQDQQAAV